MLWRFFHKQNAPFAGTAIEAIKLGNIPQRAIDIIAERFGSKPAQSVNYFSGTARLQAPSRAESCLADEIIATNTLLVDYDAHCWLVDCLKAPARVSPAIAVAATRDVATILRIMFTNGHDYSHFEDPGPGTEQTIEWLLNLTQGRTWSLWKASESAIAFDLNPGIDDAQAFVQEFRRQFPNALRNLRQGNAELVSRIQMNPTRLNFQLR